MYQSLRKSKSKLAYIIRSVFNPLIKMRLSLAIKCLHFRKTKNYYKITKRQWPLHGLGKKASQLLLLFSLLHYPYEVHSTICSDVLNGSSNKQNENQEKTLSPHNHSMKQELQNSQTAKKVKNETQKQIVTRRKYPANSEGLPDEIQAWINDEMLDSFEIYSGERIAVQEKSIFSKGKFDYNETTRRELLDESLKHDPHSVSEFFKSHDTIIADLNQGRLLIAQVKPSTNPTADQRLKAKIQLEGTVNFFLRIGNYFSLPLEFRIRMTKVLMLRMSQYLKESGISHTVFHYTPDNVFIDPERFSNIKIQIDPIRSTPMGRLATDLHERYNGIHIIYDPFTLMRLKSAATYSPHENAIILPESFFLNMDLKNPTLLHELRHVKMYKDIEYTPDSPYHLSLLGQSLSRKIAYKNNIHFSEMITYQQDSRIHLRRLVASENKNETNDDTLSNLIFSLEAGLSLNKEIEEKLSIALTFFNQTPEYFIRQSPIDLSTQTQFLQITTPNYSITLRPEPNQSYTWLEISFFAEKFTLKIPYENKVIRRANDKALQKAVKERLQLALKASIFHRRRYSVALAVAREAKETTNTEERTSLLKTLQSSQILAQKFDPNRPEESLRELSDKIPHFLYETLEEIYKRL